MMSPWQDRGTLTAGEKALEFACYGPPPGEALTLVLIHEGLGCAALWRDFPATLAEITGIGVFVYSRAGYGQSDLADLPRPLDYMTREAEDVLPAVLDAMGIGRCVLVGHSDGATIAAIYAGSIPDMRVRGIVLMAPHFFTEEMGLAEISKAKEEFETTDMPARMAKYHRNPENTFRGWNDSWLHPEFRSWNVADVIDYIRVPILVIQGRDDQYGTLAQIEVVEERSYAPVDTLILDACRHALFLDQGPKVVAAIKDYCVRLERIEAAEPENA